jgi:hypothetical protein
MGSKGDIINNLPVFLPLKRVNKFYKYCYLLPCNPGWHLSLVGKLLTENGYKIQQ